MLSSTHLLHDPPLVAMAEHNTNHNGIDILCDAAESDLLYSSHGQDQHQHQHQQQQHQSQPLVKRAKTRGGDVSTSTFPPLSGTSLSASTSASTPTAAPSHVCHLCKRVYERADHLTRHLRSHENARQYQCSRCPKRFNRADLLTRHETTHDRESDGVGRPMIRRTDRAVEACLSCATAKAKCEDKKPCSRCRAKDLPCEIPSKKTQKYRTLSDDSSNISPADDIAIPPPNLPLNPYAIHYGTTPGHPTIVPSAPAPGPGPIFTGLDTHDHLHTPPIHGGMGNDDMMFFNPVHNLFQDMDFTTWDFSFNDLTVPRFGSVPSSQSTGTAGTSGTATRGVREPGRRHAAFKRSPWLWEPEYPIDYVQRDTEGLHLSEDESLHQSSSALARSLGGLIGHLKMTAATRDRLFAIVLAEVKDHARVPSFPSLELLDYLLQAHFVQNEYHPCDSWIHAASFDPQEALPELLACVIANGASFISIPSVWQFGLAMQEIVRLRLMVLFEGSNSNTRRLDCIQTYMLSLDIGIWSGFKRRTELAEGFLMPIITMLRRAGVFTGAADSPSIVPFESDSPETLEIKWRSFIKRESYKRLALHVFLHDVQTSITFQKPPLLPFTELCFSLPAGRNLWRAPSAESWRAAYLSKPRSLPTAEIPRVSEMMHCLGVIDNLADLIDIDLCHTVLLHGFWGLVTAYRTSAKFYQLQYSHAPLSNGGNNRNATRRLWLESQQQEVYRDLSDIANHILTPLSPGFAITSELLKMTLHVSLDELQAFAGKIGEEEARRASLTLETEWIQTSDARYAVWHAGQILRCARRLPPASLRDFNAMAVYFACLALWAYGILSYCPTDREFDGTMGDDPARNRQQPSQMGPASHIVVLDGKETRETRAFVQLNRGVPGLYALPGEGRDRAAVGGAEPLSNPGMVLEVAREVLRGNFPVSSEPLPPLVESLANLLRDLGSGPAGRPSTAGSDER